MEKFDLDEGTDVSSDETSSLEVLVPEDDIYSPSEAEAAAFVAEAAPQSSGDSYQDDPRSSYGNLQEPEWPVYNYETAGGKTISIKHDDLGTFWRVEFVPGGQLPVELKGRFTNDTEAKFAVEQYLARQD